MGATHVLSLGDALGLAVTNKYIVRPVGQLGHTDMKERVLGVKMDSPVQRYNLVVKTTAKSVASMSIQVMPGCCGVVVFHSFSGEAKTVAEFIRFGCLAARREGFGVVIFTVRSESSIPGQLPSHSGKEFINGKTDHTVNLVTINLDQAPRVTKTPDTAGE